MKKSRRQRRRVCEAKNKNYTNHTPGGRKLHPASFHYAVTSKWSVSGTTSQAECNGATSQARLPALVKMSRLHCITPWQGRKPAVLSEELLLA